MDARKQEILAQISKRGLLPSSASAQSNNSETDPNYDPFTGTSRTFKDVVRDFPAMLAKTRNKANEFLAPVTEPIRQMIPEKYRFVPQLDPNEFEGKNPDSMTQGIMQFMIPGIAGKGDLLKTALLNSLFEMTQGSPSGVPKRAASGLLMGAAPELALRTGGQVAQRLFTKNAPGEQGMIGNALDKVFPSRIANKETANAENAMANAENLSRQADQAEQQIPQMTQAISQHLGKDSTSTEEIAPQIANDVRKIHDNAVSESGAYFKHVLKQVNKTKNKGLLYAKADPLISTALDEGKELLAQIDDLKTGELGTKFLNHPNFENAHNLQQELGLSIGELEKIPGKSAEQRLQLSQLREARNQLNDDMLNYLENKYPNKNEDLVTPWLTGKKLHQENVVPLLSNKKLREINRGRKLAVPNIHEAFKNPEFGNKVNANGEVELGSGEKLFNMLPQETKDKILFNRIGAHSGENANAFRKALDNALKKGYSRYQSPELKQSLDDILSHENNIEKMRTESQRLQDEAGGHERYAKLMQDKQKSRNKLYRKGTGGALAIGIEEYLRNRG